MKTLKLKNVKFLEIHKGFKYYLESLQYAKSTIYHDCAGAKEFLWFLEQNKFIKIRSVNFQVVLKYMNYISKRKHTRKENKLISISHQIKLIDAVRNMFTYLVKTGQLPYNPASEVKIRRPKHLPRNILNKKEIDTILNKIDTDTAQGLRNRTIIETLYGTGIRRSEMFNLQIQDIDLGEGIILIRNGKGNKDRYIAMSPTLIHWIKKYLNESRPDYVFNSMYFQRDGRFYPKTCCIKP